MSCLALIHAALEYERQPKGVFRSAIRLSWTSTFKLKNLRKSPCGM